MYITEFSLE